MTIFFGYLSSFLFVDLFCGFFHRNKTNCNSKSRWQILGKNILLNLNAIGMRFVRIILPEMIFHHNRNVEMAFRMRWMSQQSDHEKPKENRLMKTYSSFKIYWIKHLNKVAYRNNTFQTQFSFFFKWRQFFIWCIKIITGTKTNRILHTKYEFSKVVITKWQKSPFPVYNMKSDLHEEIAPQNLFK